MKKVNFLMIALLASSLSLSAAFKNKYNYTDERGTQYDIELQLDIRNNPVKVLKYFVHLKTSQNKTLDLSANSSILLNEKDYKKANVPFDTRFPVSIYSSPCLPEVKESVCLIPLGMDTIFLYSQGKLLSYLMLNER
jgi:hypothetical protein